MFSITQNLIIEARKLVVLNITQQLEKTIEDFLYTCHFCFDPNKYIKSILDFQKKLFEGIFKNKSSYNTRRRVRKMESYYNSIC